MGIAPRTTQCPSLCPICVPQASQLKPPSLQSPAAAHCARTRHAGGAPQTAPDAPNATAPTWPLQGPSKASTLAAPACGVMLQASMPTAACGVMAIGPQSAWSACRTTTSLEVPVRGGGGGGGKILRHKRWSLTGTEPHLALARTTPLPPNLLLPGYYATPEGLCARCPDSECGNCSSLTGACTSCNRRWGAVDGVCRPCGESGGHPVGLGPLQLTGAVLLFSPIYLPRILPPRFRMPQPTQGASGVMVSASWLGSFTQRVFQDSCWTSI